MEIQPLNLYGKQGYYFLDGDLGLFAYYNHERKSVMLERIYRGKYKEKEGIYSTPRGRGKFVSVEIPMNWLRPMFQLIDKVERHANEGERDEIGELMDELRRGGVGQ